MKIITDYALAENCLRLTKQRSATNIGVDVECKVYNGTRYITFTAMSTEEFRHRYTVINFFADMLGYSRAKETFANPNFYEDWCAIKNNVMHAIDDNPQLPIVLSGYGVAGSIAMIAGYHLTKHHKNLVRVVTFGSPPALNTNKTYSGFLCLLQQVATQYVFKNDPIPRMFRWSKYCNLDRTFIDNRCAKTGIYNYAIELEAVNTK